MSCSVGCRCYLDLALLWLLAQPAAVAPITPLAWELPYAMGVALKKQKKKEKTKLGSAHRSSVTLPITIVLKSKALFSLHSPLAAPGGAQPHPVPQNPPGILLAQAWSFLC